jgi:photosystem II stability/assembly factor-like uncharacterized protein
VSKVKKLTIVSVLSLGFILSACSGNGEEETLSPVKSGKKIEDIHGMAIAADSTTYVATHEGLFSTQDIGESWNKVGTFDADLMGFHLKSDGTMITSGHPGAKTDLPNPMGFLRSKDKGYNWEAVEFVGKIDFHLFTSSQANPDIIYGINQMGTGKYGAGLYTSSDGGEKWEKIEPTGLPEDMHQVYSLMVMPDDDSKLLAGTENGVLISEDSGKTFNIYDNSRLITAMTVMPNGTDLIGYSISNDGSGVMISPDLGQTWNKVGLDLGDDAASVISVNPKSPDHIAVTTFGTSMHVSEDGGQTWEQIITSGSLK